MIVKEEFLNNLRRYFALNLYEAKVWAALLSRGVSTAGELSDIANVPRSRSYDILESLEKKGFVVMKLGKPIKYLAVSPPEVINRVKKNMKNEADEKIKEPSDFAGSLKGRRNLYDHLEESIRKAENKVNIMTTSQGLIRKIESLKQAFQELKNKGVNIRIAAPLDNESRKLIQEELKGLAEIKEIQDINARFCTVDGKEVTFMVLDDKDVHPNYDIGIWSHSKYFASALDCLFDIAWKR